MTIYKIYDWHNKDNDVFHKFKHLTAIAGSLFFFRMLSDLTESLLVRKQNLQIYYYHMKQSDLVTNNRQMRRDEEIMWRGCSVYVSYDGWIGWMDG